MRFPTFPQNTASPLRALALGAAGLGVFASALFSLEWVGTGSQASPRSGSAAGRSHAPVISADGARIAFVSRANNLVPEVDPNRAWDVFVREASGVLKLVSVSRSGRGGGNGHSLLPAMSGDGSMVVFQSDASDLVDVDGNAASDIFARDLVSQTTSLVSVNYQGTDSGNGRSWNPLISADGRYVVFESHASNLVTNDFNGTNDIFIRDLQSAITTLVSVNAEGVSSPDGPSDSPSISADARFVAFISRGSNLAEGATNRLGEVYVRDVVQQINHWAVASHLASARDPVTLAYGATQPVLSADGRYVAFKTQRGTILRFDLSQETNTVFITFPGSPSSAFQFHDNPREGGNSGAGTSAEIVLSADGRYLAFASGSSTLIPSNTVFRTDFESFWTNVVGMAGGNLPEGVEFLTNQWPILEVVGEPLVPSGATGSNVPQLMMSTNGSLIAFLSDSTNLVTQQTGGTMQLYLRDMGGGQVHWVGSTSNASSGASRAGALPALDPSGRWLACESADGLLPTDLNNTSDVYLHDLGTGGIELVSAVGQDLQSITAAGHSFVRPKALSADGRYLTFSTLDRGLPVHDTNWNHVVRVRSLSGDPDPAFPKITNGFQRDSVLSADGQYLAYFRAVPRGSTGSFEYQAVRRDLATGSEEAFACPLVPGFSQVLAEQWAHDLSLDGRYLVHFNQVSAGTSCLVFRDLLTGSSNVVSLGLNGLLLPGFNPILSPDSQWVAFLTAQDYLTSERRRGLHLWNRLSQTNRWLTEGMSGSILTNEFAFSASSEWIAFTRSNEVILHHLSAATNLIVFSDGRAPAVSGDGRHVAAETGWAGPAGRNIVSFDRTTGEARLISRSRTGSGGGNGRSYSPCITPDGRFVVFASLASDLVENDTNGFADIFVRDTLLGTTLLASVNKRGTGSGNGPSSRPLLAADGRTVMFHSFASDLIEGDYNERRDVFLLRLGGADTDGDGLDDDWELAYFDSLARNGTGDFDGDGVSDRNEFLSGTAPTNNESILRVLTLSSSGGSGTTILWSAVPGRAYRVQFKENIEDATWEDLANVVPATGSTASASDSTPAGLRRFYRVVLVE